MHEIPPIGPGPQGPADRAPRSLDGSGGRLDPGSTRGRIEDRVEVSDRARLLSLERAGPPLRRDLVRHVREAISQGTYETSRKLQIAVGRLLEDLRA
jgi:hypothetical protein